MNQEIQRFLKRLRLGRTIESYPVTVTTAQIEGQQVHFCTNMEKDPIQRKQRKGVFYETHELEELARHFPKGGTFVDIGANVGNHSLFAAMFMGAEKIIPFEPNPRAYRLYIQNMLINGQADKVDFSKLGCGLSDVEGDGFGMQPKERNLGGAKMIDKAGDLQIFRADTLLADETPDMIKIDVEGMELGVLRGLSGLLDRCSPVIQIEVDIENDEGFQAWLAGSGYEVADTIKRYRQNLNYLLVHPQAAVKPKTTTTKTAAKNKTKTGTAKKTTTAKKVAPKTVTSKAKAASKLLADAK